MHKHNCLNKQPQEFLFFGTKIRALSLFVFLQEEHDIFCFVKSSKLHKSLMPWPPAKLYFKEFHMLCIIINSSLVLSQRNQTRILSTPTRQYLITHPSPMEFSSTNKTLIFTSPVFLTHADNRQIHKLHNQLSPIR